MASIAERKAWWDRSCAKTLERGIELERDPAFVEWIDEWIAGRTTMQAVQERYAGLVRTRGKSGGGAAPVPKSIMEEIFAEVPDTAGLGQREPQDRPDTSDAFAAAWSKNNEDHT